MAVIANLKGWNRRHGYSYLRARNPGTGSHFDRTVESPDSGLLRRYRKELSNHIKGHCICPRPWTGPKCEDADSSLCWDEYEEKVTFGLTSMKRKEQGSMDGELDVL